MTRKRKVREYSVSLDVAGRWSNHRVRARSIAEALDAACVSLGANVEPHAVVCSVGVPRASARGLDALTLDEQMALVEAASDLCDGHELLPELNGTGVFEAFVAGVSCGILDKRVKS